MVHASHIVSNPRALSPRDKNVSAVPKTREENAKIQRGEAATQRYF